VTIALSLVEKGCQPKEVCFGLGLPRATFYRHRSPPKLTYPRLPRRPPANRLSDPESAKILETMHEEDYIDLCPREIVPKLADKGIYLGSIRTFYRVLSRNEEVRERRLQARRPPIAAPVLEATGPNQIWTWDISRLAKRLEHIDYSKIVIYEKKDETEQKKELACAGGVCEIV
jgi:hypothetical protein